MENSTDIKREERKLLTILIVGAFLVLPLIVVLALLALRLLGGLLFLAYAVYAIKATSTPMPN